MRLNDKEIRRAFKELKVPASYDERMDALLESMDSEEEKSDRNKSKWLFRLVLCLLCAGIIISTMLLSIKAGILDDFKQTLMEFFGFDTQDAAEDAGVWSRPMDVESKPDLMVELKETVIDNHNIYLLVRIIAPPGVEFTEDVGFEYFGFCAGNNYDVNNLLGGSSDCRLLKTGEGKINEAEYVISMNFDEVLEDGDNVTCFVQNLAVNPYAEEPQRLVEGIWSLTFPFERTVAQSVRVEGNSEMVFTYIDTTAVVESIELSPLGMLLRADVSAFPYEMLSLSDTVIAIKLIYIDGHEQIIVSHNPEESFVQGGSTSFSEEGDKVIQQDNLEFEHILNIEGVVGFYIEDLYVPVN